MSGTQDKWFLSEFLVQTEFILSERPRQENILQRRPLSAKNTISEIHSPNMTHSLIQIYFDENIIQI